MRPTIVVLLSLALAGNLPAQRAADAVAAYAQPAAAPSTPAPGTASVPMRGDPRTGSMVVTGALFAVGGIMAGAVVGAEMANCDGDEWCDLGGAVLGALVGEVVMLPIGVHLSGDQATYGSKLRGSAAMMLGGLILAAPTGGLSLLFIPPAQLWYTIALEKRAARRNQGLAMR